MIYTYLSPFLEIGLVPDQHHHHIVPPLVAHVLDPLTRVQETDARRHDTQ